VPLTPAFLGTQARRVGAAVGLESLSAVKAVAELDVCLHRASFL